MSQWRVCSLMSLVAVWRQWNCRVGCRSLSNPQIVPRMVRTISNLHSGSASLPRDVRLSDFDTTGESVIQFTSCLLFFTYAKCLTGSWCIIEAEVSLWSVMEYCAWYVIGIRILFQRPWVIWKVIAGLPAAIFIQLCSPWHDFNWIAHLAVPLQ